MKHIIVDIILDQPNCTRWRADGWLAEWFHIEDKWWCQASFKEYASSVRLKFSHVLLWLKTPIPYDKSASTGVSCEDWIILPSKWYKIYMCTYIEPPLINSITFYTWYRRYGIRGRKDALQLETIVHRRQQTPEPPPPLYWCIDICES